MTGSILLTEHWTQTRRIVITTQAQQSSQPQPVTSVVGASVPTAPPAQPAPVTGLNPAIAEYINAVNLSLHNQLQTQNAYMHSQLQEQNVVQGTQLAAQLPQFKTIAEEANSRDWGDYAFAGGVAIATTVLTVGGIILFTGE